MPLAEAAAAAGAPSYRRLYDSAMRLLESELKLEPYPIPAGLEGNSAVVGKGRNQQVRCRRKLQTVDLRQPVRVF